MNEIETKVLDVDAEEIKKKLIDLGAVVIQDTRLTVDWYVPKGTKREEVPWFLRIRTDSAGKSECTWKGARNFNGASSTHKEINLRVLDKDAMSDLFIQIGLDINAHQEKDRVSFMYKDWQFDLDQYPGMPPYLEIEGKSEESIQEAIKLLGLEGKTATPEGERNVISKNYGLDWYNMRF